MDPQNMQGYFRGQLNNYFQTQVISKQPVYSDVEQNNAFQSSVTVTLASPLRLIVGKGSPEKSKASARESAARDACNKIQGAIGARGRGIARYRCLQRLKGMQLRLRIVHSSHCHVVR